MSNVSKKVRDTSADKTSIGFEYQFFYFIYLLLELKKEEKIGYEVEDDIHIELSNGNVIWMQLKHTLQESKSGKTINLTEKDSDIWKTLYNWCCEADKYKTYDEKNKFIQNKRFVLVTNKSSNENEFFNKIKELKNDKIKISEFRIYIKELRDNTGEKNELKKYYSKIYSFKSNLLYTLVKNIEFSLDEDLLIQKIKAQIESKFINKGRIDEVLSKLVGEFSIWKYEKVKNKGKLIIEYQEINSKCTRIFELARVDKLPRRDYPLLMPTELSSQPFIKELIEIGDMDKEDIDEIVDCTNHKLKMYNYLREWEKENLIGLEELKKFDKNTKLRWKNIHKECHSDTKDAIEDELEEKQVRRMDIKLSRKCLAKCRNINLVINGDDSLEIDLSNGQFYFLSDKERLGWQYKWREKYNVE